MDKLRRQVRPFEAGINPAGKLSRDQIYGLIIQGATGRAHNGGPPLRDDANVLFAWAIQVMEDWDMLCGVFRREKLIDVVGGDVVEVWDTEEEGKRKET